MKISELNERALIEHIQGLLARPGIKTEVCAGEDDCAVLDMGGDDYLLSTTDMLHRETDFPPQMSGWQIGWMSAAVNLSDLASKGAKPLGILMAIGIPPDTELDFFDDIIKGMDDCAQISGTQVIGGDMDSHRELTITGTALGLVNKDLLIRRSGANPGDIVCVTGNLGTAGAALISLQKKIAVNKKILKALFEPFPRINEGMALVKTRAITSMMDISDGLALSLHDIAKASSVGFKIYEDKLPVLGDVKKQLKDDELTEAVVFMGGDFELLFTVRADMINEAGKACRFSVIGEVIKEGILIERSDGIEKLECRGFEHFS
ncbi:MAG: thiamine-phosphate kinase [Candidatus Methanoperedenaceae archaeon]|nr:MAG: thiamine-phosphate kinase [Candidatus Methanoperedenaceae archaeon]